MMYMLQLRPKSTFVKESTTSVVSMICLTVGSSLSAKPSRSFASSVSVGSSLSAGSSLSVGSSPSVGSSLPAGSSLSFGSSLPVGSSLVSYTHLRLHDTSRTLVSRLLSGIPSDRSIDLPQASTISFSPSDLGTTTFREIISRSII